MSKRAERAVLAFLILVALCGFAGALLVGCKSYQPPGENLWLTIPQSQEK